MRLRLLALGSLVALCRGHCRGLDRAALINLYEALDGGHARL